MTTTLRLSYPKVLLFVALLAAIIISSSAVFAEDATTGGTTLRKQSIQQRIDTRREIAQNRIDDIREIIASRAAALRLKLQTFKDKRRAEIAERVNTNLNKINQNQTAQMQRHLTTMTSILDKLEARVNNNTPDIKDPATAAAAIAAARASIASASATVTVQARKDYTILVTTESRVRLDAQTQRQNLYKDIMAVRKIVIDAKQSVASAIRIAKSGNIPTATRSGLRKESTESGR